jgi:adenine phosphoribosyltransferase
MSSAPTAVDEILSRLVRDVPDFPAPGVLFKDICPLLADRAGFGAIVDALADAGRDDRGEARVDKVAGVEARGFILAAPVALALGVGFVPIRKAGKLPGPTYSEAYALEYGEATLEIQQDCLAAGERVLLIDDVLATGGTLASTALLISRAGGQLSAVAVLMELASLRGRDAVAGIDLRVLKTV